MKVLAGLLPFNKSRKRTPERVILGLHDSPNLSMYATQQWHLKSVQLTSLRLVAVTTRLIFVVRVSRAVDLC